MRNYNRVNDIKTEFESLVKNTTGRQQLSAVECDAVYSSIIDAYQFVLLEYGVDTFKFQEVEQVLTLSAGVNYVDLDEFVYRVVPGTPRIESEDSTLSLQDEAAFYQEDPNGDLTGLPYYYAYISSGDPNIVRLMVYPTPAQTYTMKLKGLKYPEDDMEEFPTWLMSAIKNKAKELCCISVGGMLGYKASFKDLYNDIIKQIKDGYNNGGPLHIGRTIISTNNRSVEGRIPS
jgi:hypothetical protein